MRKNWLITVYATMALAAIVVMVAVGCGGGGGPVHSGSGTAFASLLPPAQAGAKFVGNAACAKCHTAESTTFAQTIHAQEAVTCESCHGPGSIHAANPQTTNILTYPNITQAAVCAQCHAAQNQEWGSSPHAQFVADPVESDSNTCLRCHSANFHAQNIDSPTSQGVSPTTINSNILALSSTTLKSDANSTVATATCDVCHDPHGNTGNLPTYGPLAGTELFLRRATSNTTYNGACPTDASLTTNANAIGPGQTITYYTVYDQECGACHNARGANPAASALPTETSRAPFHEGPEMDMLLGITGVTGSTAAPTQGSHYLATDQCIHCHMPNGSHTFTVNLDTSCVPCHSTSDAAAQMQAVQTTVLNDLVGLQARLNSWAVTNYGAANSDSWDYTSNIPTGETVPSQSTIPIQIQEARYNYYFVILDRSNGVHNAPYAEYLLSYANQELDNLGVAPAVAHASMSIPEMKAIIQPYIDRSAAAMASDR